MSPAAAFPHHGVASCVMNNRGGGWQIVCLCGWKSSCNPLMQETGEDFDQHLWRFQVETNDSTIHALTLERDRAEKVGSMTRRRLAEEWDDYRRKVLPADAPKDQLVECRRAFYAGCGATWAAVVACNELPD